MPKTIVRQMIEHARSEVPRECCGLLAGRDSVVVAIHRLVNQASDPMREFFVAEGLFEPFRRIREAGHDLVAIYHSHPTSQAVPSTKDLERNYYGNLPHFIVSLAGAEPVIRAYRIRPESFEEIDWRVDPEVDGPR